MLLKVFIFKSLIKRQANRPWREKKQKSNLNQTTHDRHSALKLLYSAPCRYIYIKKLLSAHVQRHWTPPSWKHRGRDWWLVCGRDKERQANVLWHARGAEWRRWLNGLNEWWFAFVRLEVDHFKVNMDNRSHQTADAEVKNETRRWNPIVTRSGVHFFPPLERHFVSSPESVGVCLHGTEICSMRVQIQLLSPTICQGNQPVD